MQVDTTLMKRLVLGSAVATLAITLVGGLAVAEEAAHKSVYGKLLKVDKAQGAVMMTEDGGARLAWRVGPAIIEEALRFEPGVPLIVIYRQTTPGDKRLTALAFPGASETPTYKNRTGERIVLRSVAGVDGACEQTTGPVNESTIPDGGITEVMEAGCWCCAPAGETCTPGTKTGLGKAFLAQCFK